MSRSNDWATPLLPLEGKKHWVKHLLTRFIFSLPVSSLPLFLLSEITFPTAFMPWQEAAIQSLKTPAERAGGDVHVGWVFVCVCAFFCDCVSESKHTTQRESRQSLDMNPEVASLRNESCLDRACMWLCVCVCLWYLKICCSPLMHLPCLSLSTVLPRMRMFALAGHVWQQWGMCMTQYKYKAWWRPSHS